MAEETKTVETKNAESKLNEMLRKAKEKGKASAQKPKDNHPLLLIKTGLSAD